MKVSLSIVIPVFNEEKRIMKTFDAINSFRFREHFSSVEIIFVDDGSEDGTRDLIKGAKLDYAVKLISYPVNRGKGYAVKTGMLAATGDYCLLSDADFSTPISELIKFMPLITRGDPVIIGSRKIIGAQVLKFQGWPRRKMGEAYTLLASVITGVWASDFTCGFKCFSRAATQAIFLHSKIDRWSYDAEILFLAKKLGFKIREVGVKWINDEDTKVRLGKDAIQSFLDLLRIRKTKI